MIRFALRTTFILLFIYALMFAANFRFILTASGRWVSLLSLLALVAGWLIVRWRLKWRWHRTALDAALPLWALAVGLTLLFNPEAARRMLLPLWWMSVYIGLWYLLQDALANRGIERQTLVDALLFGGLIVLAFAAIEVRLAIQATGASTFAYRPTSVVGTNANNLGTFLMILLVFLGGQAQRVRSRLAWILLGLYGLAAGALLILTNSRGSLLGLAAVVVTGVVLWMVGQGWLRPAALRGWWGRRTPIQQTVMILAVVAALAGSGLAALKIAPALLESGRGLSGRPELFQIALRMFTENPLAGRGMNTFGRYLPLTISVPPQQMHNHAHNLYINLAGELGLVGLLAGGWTIVLLLRAAGRDWRNHAPHRQTALLALAGLAVIGLIDITTLMPGVALTTLLVFALLTAPDAPVPAPAGRWTRLRGGGIVLLWAAVLAGGVWDATLNARYVETLFPGVAAGDYAGTAEALQPVAEADPLLVIVPAQQGYLWGLAASAGDAAALPKAIAAYERAVALEPYFAPYQANLAALYWEDDRQARGLAMMQQAAALAPQSWQFQYAAGTYAEAFGDDSAARAAYTQALAANPDADLYPAWGDSPLRAELHTDFDAHTYPLRIVRLMEAGQIDAAVDLWDRNESFLLGRSPQFFVLRSLLALAQGDRAAAEQWYARAQTQEQVNFSTLWLGLNAARLARYDGDDAAADRALAAVQAARAAYDPMVLDFDAYSTNWAFDQFAREITPRYFLPEVFFPAEPVTLLHLLAET